MEAKDHWTLCESNLQKLYQAVEKYMSSFLKVPSGTPRLDIQSIARNKNPAHILLLSEHVLGIVANCSKQKEKYIDAILQLNEQHQAILMEIMVKYILQEDPSSPSNIDRELLESLQTQLREKELERISFLEHLKKLEQENSEFSGKIDSLEKAQVESSAEKQQLKKEIEELRKSSIGLEFIQREKELEAEIMGYVQEIKDLRVQWDDKDKTKNLEIAKLQDELYMVQQKLKKATTWEPVCTQQKKQIEELLENEEIYKKQLMKVTAAEDQVKELEKQNKELETNNTKLIEEYYGDKNKVMGMETEMKKAIANYSKVEKELKKSEETAHFWEQKSKQTEENLKQIQEEFDSYKLLSGAGSLMNQEKEANYQTEISKLRSQLQEIAKSTDEKIKMRMLELEAKLEVSQAEKSHLNQELSLAMQRREILEKENEDLQAKVKGLKGAEEMATGLATNLNRTKKDRDLLLDLSKRAQNALAEQQQLRGEVSKAKDEGIRLQSLLTNCEAERAEGEKRAKELHAKNLELEKRLSRDEEKIVQLQEEKKKLEAISKEQCRHAEMETERSMTGTFKSQIEDMTRKYKEKVKLLKAQIGEKDVVILKTQEDSKLLETKYNEAVRNLNQDYERTIKVLNEKLAGEKESAKKGIRELADAFKREEQTMSSYIYEISTIINQFMKDKRKGLTTTVAQQMLTKLADSTYFRNSIGSPFDIDQNRVLKESKTHKML